MTTAVFDTLKAVEGLEAAGMESRQAKAVVTTMAGAFEDTVATKTDIIAIGSDITALKAELKQDIVEVKADLKADIAEVKAEIGRLEGRLFRALWIQGGGIVALIVGLTKLL